MFRDVADGVIVGSVLVQKMEPAGARPVDQLIEKPSSLTRTRLAALG
jgi:tryptophan synthase alpha subunit